MLLLRPDLDSSPDSIKVKAVVKEFFLQKTKIDEFFFIKKKNTIHLPDKSVAIVGDSLYSLYCLDLCGIA